MISQADWGSTTEYADGALSGGWDPRYIIIHWGGLTSERNTIEQEHASLQGWQRYHLRKGWQDIAYNYAVGESGRLYRLRGENHGGHTSGVDPATGKSWSTVGVGVVWIGGQRDEDGPSAAALETMGRFVRERGLPVLGHQQTGKATSCPGPDWLEWITDKGWTLEEEMNLTAYVNAAFEHGLIQPDTPAARAYWLGLAESDPQSSEWYYFFFATLAPAHPHTHSGTVEVT